ncbi:MAG: PQQ-dependent sugar dehydrogenase [Acidobacteria bacterium]|nr:PQQ-dependent sugar dehydrogenase [Acidobacteriota bacterium]
MKSYIAILAVTPFLLTAGGTAQQPAQPPPISTVPEAAKTGLPSTPQVFAAGALKYRVVPIKGLVTPWALAFLPNGDILVTEKPGRLRIIRQGVLDPQPIAGLPEVSTKAVNAGLMDVAAHPRYAENKFIYFTYSKAVPGGPREDIRWSGNQRLKGASRDVVKATLARARFDGGATLTDVRDILVADAESQGTSGSRIVFTRDGKIIMAVGMPTRHVFGTADDAQNPGNHAGKILRLNEDGTVPSDNPFVGKAGYRPEIFALGIRNALGLFVHPDTGDIWETENGPMGGDEVNIIKAGKNYGWPVVSYGMDYSGNQEGGLSGTSSSDRMRIGMEDPFIFWNPSPAVTGIIVYTGDKFPAWKGNIFVGAMGGENLGARQLHRIVLSPTGRPQSRGNLSMLTELKQRIRDVRQGPDGNIYLTTDEADGAVLRIEPAQ